MLQRRDMRFEVGVTGDAGALRTFVEANLAYVARRVAENPGDPFWHHVGLAHAQQAAGYEGFCAAYAAQGKAAAERGDLARAEEMFLAASKPELALAVRAKEPLLLVRSANGAKVIVWLTRLIVRASLVVFDSLEPALLLAVTVKR